MTKTYSERLLCWPSGITRIQSLMRSFVYWPNMDKDIENTVKLCKGCALAAKAPPVKFNHWLETDLPWSRIYLELAGPLEGYYYLIVRQFFKVARSSKV